MVFWYIPVCMAFLCVFFLFFSVAFLEMLCVFSRLGHYFLDVSQTVFEILLVFFPFVCHDSVALCVSCTFLR